MLLAGARGHALELVELVLENGYLPHNISFFDDVYSYQVKDLNGIKLITSLEEAHDWLAKDNEFALAIGSSKARTILAEKLRKAGGALVSVIASSAIISRNNVELNPGINIMNFCMVSANIKIGQGVLINAYASIHHDVVIGDFSEIAPGCRILGGAEIGDNCFIGSGAVILPKVKVGSGAIVGAGAVVTQNVASGTTVIGVPAKVKLS